MSLVITHLQTGTRGTDTTYAKINKFQLKKIMNQEKK